MKTKKLVKLIFRTSALALLCVAFTLSIIDGQWIWGLTIAAGLTYELSKLLS